jgi:hypothetical protein
VTAHHPIPTAEIARQLDTEGYHRGRWVAIGIVFALMAGAIMVLTLLVLSQRSQIKQQQDEIRSACSFYRPLAVLVPVTPKGATHPTRFGVQIIAGSRASYIGYGCQPPLKPLSRAMRADERFYHIG